MFRPMRMDLMTVVCLKDDWPNVGSALARCGCVEVERAGEVVASREGLSPVEQDGLLQRLEELRRRADAIAGRLALDHATPDGPVRLGEPEELAADVEQGLGEM